ncbi:MAG TPA: ketoacyl-ACP synthase III [Terracidiphilus sp.]|nr:ketoacyl-ACP synthase III [Terracidiphilus sp.]
MHASLAAIEYYLPEKTVSTADLAREFPDWSAAKIEAKTGIGCRHIAAQDQCSSDLAVAAAQKLFAGGSVHAEEIDYLILCTQSPDHFLPTTACLIQDRLGIPTSTGAVDINLGCSGYIYGLGLAEGLIATGQARSVLLLTAETYSKFMNERDRSVRTVFGDAAAATLLKAVDTKEALLGPFVYGTDGAGGPNLIVPAGGMRQPRSAASAVEADDQGNVRSQDDLFMNGPEIFNFTLSAVPESIERLLQKASVALQDIDLFVFHQANRYMLDHLRKRLHIPSEKFYFALENCGNTVSSTIPIALRKASLEGVLKPGSLTMLVGFGVGYSWGAMLLQPSAMS